MLRGHLLVVIALVCACGPGASSPVVMPPLHITANPPAPERARWVFSGPEKELRAKLDIGDGRTLYVGEHGRRALLAKAGDLTHAPTLALESLTGVMRDDVKKRFVFVAMDGDVYASTEPLGPLERVGQPRAETDALSSVTTGRAAILGIAKNGGVMRSADFGATWRPVDYARAKLVGGAAAVALDSKGNGVLLHLPQHLFVTHDDGATWAPLASPESGAVWVKRDGADRIFVVGYQQRATLLDGDKLTPTSDSPSAIYTVPSNATDDAPKGTRTMLVGDHVVQLVVRDADKPLETRSARLGETLPATWTPHAELVPSAQTTTLRLATHGGELVYLRAEDPNTDDETTKPLTTTILRSKDWGVTWQKEDVLQGTFNEDIRVTKVAIGPRGWMYVAPLCQSQYSHDCKPPKVRPAGKRAFEDIVSNDQYTPLGFVFDEPRSKVYMHAFHEGRQVVYELPLDGTKLTRTDVLSALPRTDVAVTVDAHGGLRAFERYTPRYWTVRRRSAKGEAQEPVFVPIRGDVLALSGTRGLSVAEHESWETSDAGDTWTRVPSNGSTNKLACNDSGCLLDDAQRVGWDLPAATSTDVLRAQDKAPDDAPVVKPAPPRKPPLVVACKTSGTPVPLELVDWADGTSAARWAKLDNELVWGSKDAVHRTTLMPPAPKETAKGTQVRSGQEERDNGMVEARYRFAPRTGDHYSTVNVELAWWSAATGLSHHGVLPSVKPFRVGRFQFSGAASIVDGGLAFHGATDYVVHFVHDDGKDEQLTSPGIAFTEAWHSGKRWVVADVTTEIVALAASEDGGKTWTRHSWGMTVPGFLPTPVEGALETVSGHAALRLVDWLFDIGSPPLGADPPNPTLVDSSDVDGRCEGPAVGTLRHVELVEGGAPVVVGIDRKAHPAALEAFARVEHDQATGKPCTSLYVMHERGIGYSPDREAFLVPDKNGWSGWYRHASEDPKKPDQSVIEPLVCTK
jgi:photosystem II stability/assembly factor-like uncharacterized protein